MSFGIQFEAAMREFAELGGFVTTNGNDTVVAAKDRGNTVEFATAVCAPHDTFVLAVGMALAVERYLDGKTVTMRREDCVFLD